jgi:hypothetical protein
MDHSVSWEEQHPGGPAFEHSWHLVGRCSCGSWTDVVVTDTADGVDLDAVKLDAEAKMSHNSFPEQDQTAVTDEVRTAGLEPSHMPQPVIVEGTVSTSGGTDG